MPKVGKGNKVVHYPYSQKGIKDAIAHSKRTGESVSMEYGHGGMIPKYRGGGMVPNRPNRMRGPGVPLRRSAPRPPGQNAPQGFGDVNWNNAPHYGPHRGLPIPPSLGGPGPSPVSPRPPGAGMRPPVNPGLYKKGGKVKKR